MYNKIKRNFAQGVNRVFFYSNVKDKELFFLQQFYAIDIAILEKLGFVVVPTNKISDFLKFWKYDIGFFYFYKYSCFPALISKLFLKKNYFTGGIDDFSSSTKSIFYRQKFFFFISYLVANKCIIVSNSDMINIKKIYNNRLKKRLAFSYHGINISDFVCSDYDFKKKERIFTTVAWQGLKENVIRKGVDKALFIFAELKKLERFSDYHFYIIGKCGEGSVYLKQLINDLKIQDSVFFTDEISEKNKIKYLKRSSFYFQLSSYEGFGIAALEALAAKNIIIHSGNGGLKDVVSGDGILVNEDDNLIEICKKINQFDLRVLQNAEKRILNNFTIERRSEDFRNIISSK